MKQWIRLFAFIPALGMMFTIWSFSANSGEASSNQSEGIVSKVIIAMENFTGNSLTEEERAVWEERIHTPIRKIAHVSEYMVLAITVLCPLAMYIKCKKKLYFISAFFCIFYAGLDEIHQLYVPGRSGSAKDVCVDAIGILIGVTLFHYVKRLKT